MRITNIDTLSALLDRLITENIKLFFFEKDKLEKKSIHQKHIINEIKKKLTELFLEVYNKKSYDYLDEKRTFTASNIIEEISELVTNDIHIGESDRARLNIVMKEEKRLRKSNEGRSKNKNNIDKEFNNFINE
tara:strand:+ start:2858 stop:3256 length:399 start_codon:yes stop_codon:yes gene_type:complete